jgi:hypothetical protein
VLLHRIFQYVGRDPESLAQNLTLHDSVDDVPHRAERKVAKPKRRVKQFLDEEAKEDKRKSENTNYRQFYKIRLTNMYVLFGSHRTRREDLLRLRECRGEITKAEEKE